MGITVVRHGETAWSRTGRHTGVTDVALSPEGEEQARALGPDLALLRPRTVLVSPLGRARRTAELAGFPDAVVDLDLHEWDYGAYEGLTTGEIRARLGRSWTVFADGVVSGTTPGETIAAVSARVDRVIARVLDDARAGEVLLFSHGHLLRVLGARWVGQEGAFGAHLALGTAATSRLDWEHDVPVLQEWNRQPGLG